MKKLFTLLALMFFLNGWGQCSISISGYPVICAGSTGTYTASGASTYTWAPAAGLGTTSGAVVTITPTGNTVYTVTGTTGTCTATNTLAITVNPLPSPPVLSGTTSNPLIECQGQTATALNLTPVSGVVAVWYMGTTAGSPVINLGNSYVPPTNVVGTTVYSIKDSTYFAGGCTSTPITVTVTVSSAPGPPVLSGPGTNPIAACQSTAVSMSVTPTGTLASVPVWYSGSDFVSVGNTYTPSSSIIGTTVYTVYDSAAASTGCTSTALTVTVIVNPSPIVTYTLVQDVAPHTWDIYPSITGGTPGYTYIWNWGDGSANSTSAYPNHTYSVAGTYSICAIITDANGCAVTYCQNDAVFRPGNNNSTLNNMVNVNVLSGNAPVYQKLLADSVTEFDEVGVCLFARQQNGTQQTWSNCINTQNNYPGALNAWYVKGDSLYNGKTYKKVTYSNVFQGLMREDTIAKRVYFVQYCNTNEELLYDFSLSQGDTISYHLQSFNSSMSSGVFTVDSIRLRHDYKNYDHKHFYLRNHAVSNNITLEMIEGVGNVSHPLFLYYHFQSDLYGAFPSCSSANFDEALSCKFNNGTKVYADSCLFYEARLHAGFSLDSCSYCWGATGGIEKYQTVEKVTIYPNPSSGNFVIETNATIKQTVQVYDVNGRIVLTQNINNKASIDVTSLPNGIYNVSVINNEGVVNKRVVISH